MKKILIITYMFPPDNNPRSFRAFELANELAKNYDVTVLTKENTFDKKEYLNINNLKIIDIPSGFKFNKNQNSKIQQVAVKNRQGFLYNISKKIYNYLFYSREIEFAFEINKAFKNKVNKDYDIVISIANPFACHIGTWSAFRQDKNKKIILDYGDPFSYNPAVSKNAFYFKFLEKTILKFADHIIVPVNEAVKSFEKFGKDIVKKIEIIPQGLNIGSVQILKYKKNDIPTFMYAGAFYEEIRNPLNFFKIINKISINYKFYIYTDIDRLKTTVFGKILFEEIKKNKRIILKDKISRNECIKKMSTMDFLINLQNLGGVQVPSKLIDYGVANRPVYSFSQENFKIKILKKFFNNDYTDSLNIDISKYDIKIIAKKFENLFGSDNEC